MSTYVPIQAITLSAAASSVDFTGIPQIFTDLVIVASARYVSTNTGQGLGIRFNGDTSSNYSFTILEGNGSAASSYRVSNTTSGAMGAVANGSQSSFAVVSTSIQNYRNNTTTKTYITRQSGPSFVQGIVGLWRATPAPITSISILGSGTAGNIDSGSTFTLYGVGSGSPRAFGGDEVRTDGTFWYHIFRSSGRFEPVQNLTNVDYLVVAGGGAGGGTTNDAGGGGGAGGYRTSLSGGGTALSLTANTTYPVTVGAGGAGVSNNRGGKGSNSIFASITSTGGGGGGGSLNGNGQAGGSGGGGGTGGGNPGGAGNEGGYSPVEGFAGSTSYGGGGGASGAATNNFGANGVANSISGTSVFYAGGGGSLNATASLGGGGRGEGPNGANNMTAGTANTGGGGGATWGPTGQGAKTGMAGGSGIVIVRYLV